jgi:hypothetical protein
MKRMPVTDHGDIAQRTRLVDSAGEFDRVKHRGQAAERIDARTEDFAGDIDRYLSDLADRDVVLGLDIAFADGRIETAPEIAEAAAGRRNRTQARQRDITVAVDEYIVGCIFPVLCSALRSESYRIREPQCLHLASGSGSDRDVGEGGGGRVNVPHSPSRAESLG